MRAIQFKRSEVPGKAPLAEDILLAELAVNLADRKIYSKNSEGEVISLSATSVNEVEGLQEALDLKRDLTDNNFTNYTLTSTDTTGEIDLNTAQLFRIDSSVSRTLSFANVPDSTKATTIVVYLHNITEGVEHQWPAGINWGGGDVPYMEGSWMNIVLLWTGSEWVGTIGSSEITRFDLGEM